MTLVDWVIASIIGVPLIIIALALLAIGIADLIEAIKRR